MSGSFQFFLLIFNEHVLKRKKSLIYKIICYVTKSYVTKNQASKKSLILLSNGYFLFFLKIFRIRETNSEKNNDPQSWLEGLNNKYKNKNLNNHINSCTLYISVNSFFHDRPVYSTVWIYSIQYWRNRLFETMWLCTVILFFIQQQILTTYSSRNFYE